MLPPNQLHSEDQDQAPRPPLPPPPVHGPAAEACARFPAYDPAREVAGQSCASTTAAPVPTAFPGPSRIANVVTFAEHLAHSTENKGHSGDNNSMNTVAQALAEAIRGLAPKPAKKASDFPLPSFAGAVSEWLGFSRLYERSKEFFSDVENLGRLAAALRGAARESVSSLLWAADTPDIIMSALERQFGNPELIIIQIVSEVRALPKLGLYDSGREINLMACRIRNCVETIRLLKMPEYLANPELVYAILAKLTPLLREKWVEFAYSRQNLKKFKLELLSEFLVYEADMHLKFGMNVIESVKAGKDKVHVTATKEIASTSSVSTKEAALPTFPKTSKVNTCPYCFSGDHNIDVCQKFRSLSVDQRVQWVADNKLCRKCLKKGSHSYRNCKKSCKVKDCKSKQHHSLLHSAKVFYVTDPQCSASDEEPKEPMDSQTVAHISPAPSTGSRPMLKILPVSVSGPKGSVDTFALLDDGSSATFIDSIVAAKIGAVGPRSCVEVNCLSGLSKQTTVEYVDFSIRGRGCDHTFEVRRARAIVNLGIARQSLSAKDLACAHLVELKDVLATFCDAQPMLIIGVDNWHLTIPTEVRTGGFNQPVACHTALGWVIYGFGSSRTRPVSTCPTYYVSQQQPTDVGPIDFLIKEHYKLDSIGIQKKEHPSPDDQRAIAIIKDTTRRLPSGRFQTGLPWKADIGKVPRSYPLALSRFLNLERRFARDRAYAEAYKANINATIEKGYAELCQAPPAAGQVSWYLPHFGVVHPQKKKLRVVHDAAAKCQGVSLNSMLLQGPDLLQPLLAILMRFREGRVALNGDIQEMFPQTKIREEDRDAQRFLWREDPSLPIQEYRMASMIFGASSSPFVAQYLKNLNAEEHKEAYPAAAAAIVRDYYMDDYLGSVDNHEEAAQLAFDIVQVHAKAGLTMRSWVSNSMHALAKLPVDLCASSVAEVALANPSASVKVLGVMWNICEDTLGFRASLVESPPTKWTKRLVLSHLMRVYDPLGLLTPIVIRGRILFQSIWISELAYSCVAYWRFVYTDGSTKLALIGGKARLAPLKPVSIPRLELQAALIAARFADYIISSHRHKPNQTFFWSDSLTVLKWLRGDARTFKAFVSYRVGEIWEITDVSSWRYVPTALNVADDATRAQSKFDASRWFSGPPFLLLDPLAWPQEPPAASVNPDPALQELKHPLEQVGFVDDPGEARLLVVADHHRFSDWLRLVRAAARVRVCAKTFLNILPTYKFDLGAKIGRLSQLSAADIAEAERNLLIQSQTDSFPQELACVRRSAPMPKGSRLKGLLLMVQDGLLRLSSRIRGAQLVPSTRDLQPAVLDGRHPIVHLLIGHVHRRLAHGGTESTVNDLRVSFHVLHLRPSVKTVLSRCMICRIRKASPRVPPFGDLPAGRVALCKRPFSHVGVDYFGPVSVTSGRRHLKRYVALFTCMTVRAVHLEVAENLSADSALLALRRFIARRGCPTDIYSDNGTNFVGAARQLSEMYDFAANNKIHWHFSTPSAPFMGGCWERLIRSVKTALSITLKDRSPREEVLLTFLLEAEATVNSRPLSHVAVGADDEEALTPFHFLIGGPQRDATIRGLSDEDMCGRKDYKKSLRLADHFWQRWAKEVLPCLAPRRAGVASSLNVGDLVLIVDGSLPRACWPRGRVVRTYPGRDGRVRTVDVATKAGTLKRAVRLLVPLPVGTCPLP